MKTGKPRRVGTQAVAVAHRTPNGFPNGDHDEHCVAWVRHEFHVGRRPEWIPEELLDALLKAEAGDMRLLAAYVRAYGVPAILTAHVADMIEGRGTWPTRLQLRTKAILEFVKWHRVHHAQQLHSLQSDPTQRMLFVSIRQIHEHAAAHFLGDADQWQTVEKLEQRHKND